MSAPIAQLIDHYTAVPGDEVELDTGQVHPLRMTVTAASEDRYRMRGAFLHGFDQQGRFHTVRVERPA